MENAFSPTVAALDYARIERAITYLETHWMQQPALADVAAHVSLSPAHFQRLFTQWAGVSPKKFAQFLTLDYARRGLRSGQTLEIVADGAGLSGPSRLHDLLVTLEGVTPGQFARAGSGLTLRWAVLNSPFGAFLLAATPDDRVTHLAFLSTETDAFATAFTHLRATWPAAALVEDPVGLATLAERIFPSAPHPHPAEPATAARSPLALLICGTSFQLRVWEALLRLPLGAVASYDAIGTAIGAPTASRAVGTAVGANPVAWLIPCHRVIQKSGRFGAYRWGAARKRALLGWEAAQIASSDVTEANETAEPPAGAQTVLLF